LNVESLVELPVGATARYSG